MNKYEHLAKQARFERQRFRSCEKKKRFSSKEQAELQPNQMVYNCKFCNGWHRSGSVLGLTKKRRQ